MKSKAKTSKVKDHLVSGEIFEVHYHEDFEYASTEIAEGLDLSQYYPKTNYASHLQKPKGIKGKLYVLVQSLMLRYKRSIIKQHQNDIQLLDVGGGIGVFAHYLKERGDQVQLVEPSASARKIATYKGLKTYRSLNEIPKARAFSVISLWHVLEHVKNLEESLQSYSKLLSSKGLIVIAVPNLNSFDAQYYGSNWAALDVPRHLWHFTENGIVRKLDEQGFSFIKSYPLWFDAFYIASLSEGYAGNKFAFFRGILIGLFSNLKAAFTKEYSSKIYLFKKKTRVLEH